MMESQSPDKLRKSFSRVQKITLVLFVLILCVLGLIVGFYFTSDMLRGPFEHVTYAYAGDSTLSINLKTRNMSRTRIEYGTSEEILNESFSDDYRENHSFTIKGLLPGKPHLFRVVAESKDGELYTSQFYTIE